MRARGGVGVTEANEAHVAAFRVIFVGPADSGFREEGRRGGTLGYAERLRLLVLEADLLFSKLLRVSESVVK
jgi:hypothetical protein